MPARAYSGMLTRNTARQSASASNDKRSPSRSSTHSPLCTISVTVVTPTLITHDGLRPSTLADTTTGSTVRLLPGSTSRRSGCGDAPRAPGPAEPPVPEAGTPVKDTWTCCLLRRESSKDRLSAATDSRPRVRPVLGSFTRLNIGWSADPTSMRQGAVLLGAEDDKDDGGGRRSPPLTSLKVALPAPPDKEPLPYGCPATLRGDAVELAGE